MSNEITDHLPPDWENEPALVEMSSDLLHNFRVVCLLFYEMGHRWKREMSCRRCHDAPLFHVRMAMHLLYLAEQLGPRFEHVYNDPYDGFDYGQYLEE